MATTAMPETTVSSTDRSQDGGAAVQAIIAAARLPQRAASRGAWLCGAASALLWYCSFFPLNWGPVAFLAPVPLLLLARLEDRPRHLYLAVYVTWLVASLAACVWMAANVPMVPAWIALALYMAVYAPLFVLGCRSAVQRLHIPLVVAAPVVWTGLELVRAYLMTGFPWYFLGHTQWRWTTLIQISDLVGVYGVSFVVMTAAAAVAVCVPEQIFTRLRLLAVRDGIVSPPPSVSLRQKVVSVACGVVLLTAALGYGVVRTSGEHFSAGPRIALVQGNFPSEIRPTHSHGEVWTMQNRLTAMAVAYQPDFVVWPESAYRWPMFDARPELSDVQLNVASRKVGMAPAEWREASATVKEILGDLSTQANAAMVVGLTAFTADAEHGLRRYNSATFARPEIGFEGRYDKRHRVVFGEYVPLRDVFPFLHALTPYTEGFSIDAGERPVTFRHGGHSITPLICFEDTVPHLVRSVIARSEAGSGEGVDVLVNITNDGWFDHSAEQEQHLVTSLFRAVETRTPLVRSANTGISAAIDGDGRIVKPVAFVDGDRNEPTAMTDRRGRFKKDLNAVVVADVPLDSRSSLYVRFGDWFGMTCAAAAVFCMAWTFVPRKSA
jgi:apolipoprotein N-acyltransferase